MIVKEHKSKSGIILSVCDDVLIGKKLREGELVLDLSADFYSGKSLSKDEAEKKCRKAYIINAVGESSVDLLKSLGLVDKNKILIIEGVPFAQCLILENEV